LLSSLASKLDTRLGAGPAPPIELHQPGPYDERLGYARLPRELERLHQDGWRVVAQARLSPLHDRLVRLGMSPIYREKTQTGLEIVDARGDRLYEVRYPGRIYQDFASVPPLVTQTLTFIENRELLDPVHVFRNPAVEWDRLATAGPRVAWFASEGTRRLDARDPARSRATTRRSHAVRGRSCDR
jgi:membrane peptidoglycan carboxypeptidase